MNMVLPSPLWHLYLLECMDGSLYTGITTNLERRLHEHLNGKGARYTCSHKPRHLVASSPVGSQSDALRAEIAIKRLPKEKKLAAVQSLARPLTLNSHRNDIMNKTELIEAIAKSAELSKADAERALSAVIDTVVKTVAKGDTVTLVGFGTFKSSKRAARTGRNPATGAALKIAATTVARFTAGATFKAAVAGKKAAKKK
jgi:DNA-binding protein HU-beta